MSDNEDANDVSEERNESVGSIGVLSDQEIIDTRNNNIITFNIFSFSFFSFDLHVKSLNFIVQQDKKPCPQWAIEVA